MTQIPEEKLKEWREEFKEWSEDYWKDDLDMAKDGCEYSDSWSAFKAAKTSSYEREMKLVEALKKYSSESVLEDSFIARQTLKELGHE